MKILINSRVFFFKYFVFTCWSLASIQNISPQPVFLCSKLTRESGTDFPIIQGATESETEKLIREKDEEVRHAGHESHQQHERSEAESEETPSDQKRDEEL